MTDANVSHCMYFSWVYTMNTIMAEQKHPVQQDATVFGHLLLPIDGSELSWRAFALGLKMAKLSAAKVSVIHAVPPFHSIAYMTELLAAMELSYSQQAVKSATGYMERAKELANAAHIPCECHFAFGEHPHEVILNAVDEHHCDLIVMASHGWHGLNSLILGSETQKVISKSTIPVLVCH